MVAVEHDEPAVGILEERINLWVRGGSDSKELLLDWDGPPLLVLSLRLESWKLSLSLCSSPWFTFPPLMVDIAVVLVVAAVVLWSASIIWSPILILPPPWSTRLCSRGIFFFTFSARPAICEPKGAV